MDENGEILLLHASKKERAPTRSTLVQWLWFQILQTKIFEVIYNIPVFTGLQENLSCKYRAKVLYSIGYSNKNSTSILPFCDERLDADQQIPSESYFHLFSKILFQGNYNLD